MKPLRVKKYIDTLGIPGQIEGIDGRLDATEGDISTAQSDITSLDTRVTTAETDITARPTSPHLAAPEGAAGIGTAAGGTFGRRAWRESVCQYVWISVVAVT